MEPRKIARCIVPCVLMNGWGNCLFGFSLFNGYLFVSMDLYIGGIVDNVINGHLTRHFGPLFRVMIFGCDEC